VEDRKLDQVDLGMEHKRGGILTSISRVYLRGGALAREDTTVRTDTPIKRVSTWGSKLLR